MKPKLFSAFLIIVLLAAVFAGTALPFADADMMPPSDYASVNSGGPYCIANNVTMPSAEVNISILVSESWRYDINVSCSFMISSAVAQNLTTAFVYPTAWSMEFTGEEDEIDLNMFEISVNQSATEYTVLSYDEFVHRFSLDATEWRFIHHCAFALLNLTAGNNTNYCIDVETSFTIISTAFDFRLEYIVGTARSWDGNTHEIVRMNIRNEAEILGYGFFPDINLVSEGDNESGQAIWEFDISEFEYDRVYFTVNQKKHPDGHRVVLPTPFAFLSALAVIVILVGLVVFIRWGHIR
ncbi:MAG: hypothetical protein KAU89_08080 [Candidatus Thorarchaeota archaeon]|nr:hypothetical protein [Candidatus Thorarchaeota archaeon]